MRKSKNQKDSRVVIQQPQQCVRNYIINGNRLEFIKSDDLKKLIKKTK